MHGVVFSDFHVGREGCEQQMPRELSGVVLTFTDEDEMVLAETTTGPVRLQALPDG